MADNWTNQLSAYIDGEMSAAERNDLERHLGACSECRTALGQLKALVSWARAYQGREPESDAWPGVAAAIKRSPRAIADLGAARVAKSRLRRLRVPQALAAGIVLAIVAAGSWWIARATAPRDRFAAAIDVSAAGAGTAIGAAIHAARSYGPAIAELERALFLEQGTLDSSTVRVVRHKLAIIDRALAEAGEALERDPNSDYLADHFAGMMKKKLTVLRAAARGAAVRS